MKLLRHAVAPAFLALVTAVGATGATSFSVASSITNGQILNGKPRWTATVTGIPAANVSTVDFFVDGARQSTEKGEPYVYGGDQGLLDTTALANGTHVFAVTATATDGSKASVTATATTKNAPLNTTKPSISGTARDASTLSADRGRWTGPGTITYAYGWLRCDGAGNACTAIGGATSSSYKPSASDIGRRLRVAVGATNDAGSLVVQSDPTTVVAARGSAPASSSLPSIAGSARDGSLLTASRGNWTNNPSSYAYQWLRCDSNAANCGSIAGANARQYTLSTTDVGRRLRITITASNSFGSGTATSSPTGAVEATGTAPASTSPPAIAGTTKPGNAVTASNGGWSGSQPFTLGYVWRRCDATGNACADIAGAASATYVLTTSDVAHTLRVVVTARNARGAAAATSEPTSLVTPSRPGEQTIDVAQVSLPSTLVIDRVRFSPNPVRSRLAPIVARFHVSDSRGFSVAGALVYALGLPYGWVPNGPEALTDGVGWATVVMQPAAGMPRRGSLVVFVRARKPGESVLSGVTARRLVQEGIRRR